MGVTSVLMGYRFPLVGIAMHGIHTCTKTWSVRLALHVPVLSVFCCLCHFLYNPIAEQVRKRKEDQGDRLLDLDLRHVWYFGEGELRIGLGG